MRAAVLHNGRFAALFSPRGAAAGAPFRVKDVLQTCAASLIKLRKRSGARDADLTASASSPSGHYLALARHKTRSRRLHENTRLEMQEAAGNEMMLQAAQAAYLRERHRENLKISREVVRREKRDKRRQ